MQHATNYTANLNELCVNFEKLQEVMRLNIFTLLVFLRHGYYS